MSDIDRQCQEIVDRLAAKLLTLSPDELLARPEYGVLHYEVSGETVPVGFWHHAFDRGHHIYFKLHRRWFWFMSKTYLSGVVFGPDSPSTLQEWPNLIPKTTTSCLKLRNYIIITSIQRKSVISYIFVKVFFSGWR